MDGSEELMRLAQLLRLGAETGRRVASFRPADRDDIERLARQAESMADELEAMVSEGSDRQSDGDTGPGRGRPTPSGSA